MTYIAPIDFPLTLPDHTQLPESDGTFVKNFQAHPQSILLTDSIQLCFSSVTLTDSIALVKIAGFIGD